MAPTSLVEAARADLGEVISVRRRIHRRPELGLDLPRTQATVLEALESLGLEVRTGTRTTSVVADLVGDAPGPTVLLRGDMDALPMPEDTDLPFASEVAGAMHACGHDAHTAMLVGAARLLAAQRADVPGRVRFMFQPGEEGFHGARVMIEEGVLDGVDAAFALHVTPNIPAGMVATRGGALLASADTFSVEVRGRGGHASTPYLAGDPVPVACEIVTALQTWVTRRVDVFDPAVVTVGKIRAGSTDNVIPEVARMLGTVRAVSERTRDHVHQGIEQVATGIAAAHGMTASVEMEHGYPVTVNHPAFADAVRATAQEVLGAGRVFEMPSPVMGAEDFSYVLQQVPGAMAYLGVCPEGARAAHAAGCHSNRMVLDEDAMAAGVATHVAVAQAVLRGDFDHALGR